MFFMCLCLFIAATFAFMWNKKQAMKELRESGDVKNDAPKPIMPVISDSLNKSERELGSLEHDQIIKKATMMHFGGRPNMKDPNALEALIGTEALAARAGSSEHGPTVEDGQKDALKKGAFDRLLSPTTESGLSKRFDTPKRPCRIMQQVLNSSQLLINDPPCNSSSKQMRKTHKYPGQSLGNPKDWPNPHGKSLRPWVHQKWMEGDGTLT
ncbi:hypothetical protein Scep_026205 [Stephania cephalantha]|uniref:Uncharacterized protein n=1 Tax=Stephania cephalantha TaxID=152367 RepID=A0AAP0EJQ5_9MAGN